MIIATAGHVDHGKTTLVQAITGIHTDRQPEAQARGMTIDLGFAHWQPAPGLRVGFTDVPGHERLVRNMLAGVAAIDLALLVVAADDGPMPQTREHLAILTLLGVPQLVVALTKTDQVDPSRQAAALFEVAQLLQGGPFAGAAVFPVDALSGHGLAPLCQHLAAAAAALARQPPTGFFRLAIDRSFTVDGAGRVVTGAVLAGTVRVGDAVQLLPQGSGLRVRGLQVLGEAVDAARAGQRCAVNLAGTKLKRAAPERGDWLVAEGAAGVADRLDVQLQWPPGADAAPGPRAQLVLHLGAAAVPARLSVLDADLPPPDRHPKMARLQLARPVSAAWGDHFILRDGAAHRTLAGGWVVDACGPARDTRQPQRLAQLAALSLADPLAALMAWVDSAPDGVDLAQFARARSLQPAEATVLHQQMGLHVLPGPAGPLGLTRPQWLAWQARVLQAVDDWHVRQPDCLGPDEAALRRQLVAGGAAGPAAHALLHASLAAAVASGSLVRDGLSHRRPGHRPVLAADDAALLARITPLLQADGLRPPIHGDLAVQLTLPVPALQAGLARLVERGLLVAVAPNRVYLPELVTQLAAEARALAAASPDGAYDAAAYRDRTGIGRNLTVQVIEFLDRAGITRFDGKRHHLRA
jgi:selenocysteine-specific elongation factor